MRLERDGVVVRALTADDVERVEQMQSEPSVARWWGEPDREELEPKARGEDEATAFAIEVDGSSRGSSSTTKRTTPTFGTRGSTSSSPRASRAAASDRPRSACSQSISSTSAETTGS